MSDEHFSIYKTYTIHTYIKIFQAGFFFFCNDSIGEDLIGNSICQVLLYIMLLQ